MIPVTKEDYTTNPTFPKDTSQIKNITFDAVKDRCKGKPQENSNQTSGEFSSLLGEELFKELKLDIGGWGKWNLKEVYCGV